MYLSEMITIVLSVCHCTYIYIESSTNFSDHLSEEDVLPVSKNDMSLMLTNAPCLIKECLHVSDIILLVFVILNSNLLKKTAFEISWATSPPKVNNINRISSILLSLIL